MTRLGYSLWEIEAYLKAVGFILMVGFITISCIVLGIAYIIDKLKGN